MMATKRPRYIRLEHYEWPSGKQIDEFLNEHVSSSYRVTGHSREGVSALHEGERVYGWHYVVLLERIDK